MSHGGERGMRSQNVKLSFSATKTHNDEVNVLLVQLLKALDHEREGYKHFHGRVPNSQWHRDEEDSADEADVEIERDDVLRGRRMRETERSKDRLSLGLPFDNG